MVHHGASPFHSHVKMPQVLPAAALWRRRCSKGLCITGWDPEECHDHNSIPTQGGPGWCWICLERFDNMTIRKNHSEFTLLTWWVRDLWVPNKTTRGYATYIWCAMPGYLKCEWPRTVLRQWCLSTSKGGPTEGCSILQYCSQVNMLEQSEQSAVFQCCSFFSEFAPALRLHEDGAESCDFRFNPRWCLAGRPLEGEPLGHPGGTGETVMLKQYTLVTHYKIC